MSNLPIHMPAIGRSRVPGECLPDTPISEYFLVFTDSSQWISEWLKPHFAHCYILQRDQYNWFVLNPERLHLRVEIAPVEATQDLIKLWCKPTDTVLKLEFKPRHTTIRFGWFGVFSCVTLVRYLLGLKLKALTPYGLYRKLLTLSDEEKSSLRLDNVTLIKQGS